MKDKLLIFLLFPTTFLFMIGVGYYIFLNNQIGINYETQPTRTTLTESITPRDTRDNNVTDGYRVWVNMSNLRINGPNISVIIDYLEPNPCWKPGGFSDVECPNSEYFLNTEPEAIEISISKSAKIYFCMMDYGSHLDLGSDNDATSPDTEVPLSYLIQKLNQHQEPVDYFVDIENHQITAIYERCLP
jgi:hypothetical protein